jgi:glutathione S-transferase
MAAELILHHYGVSPFSEKLRLVLGMKRLAWRSVDVPRVLPKPDVMPLTGGYRRTPFLQIGADVYCDTRLACLVIDALAPAPPLYPAAVRGLAEIVAEWADTQLFWLAVPFTMQPSTVAHMFPDATPASMKAFAEDRAAMSPNFVRATIPDASAQLATYFGRIEQMLGDGRPYLLGAEPSIADVSAAHPLWYMRKAPPIGAMLDGYPKLAAWHARVLAFGHGTPTELSAADALAVASGASGHAVTTVAEHAGFAAGDAVTVTPTDYARDSVSGQLVGLTQDEVVVERRDERAGVVHVHFPRVGFQIKKA